MIKHTDEFKREAVRIALTCGLPRDRVASNLGVGKSTLHKCKFAITLRVHNGKIAMGSSASHTAPAASPALQLAYGFPRACRMTDFEIEVHSPLYLANTGNPLRFGAG